MTSSRRSEPDVLVEKIARVIDRRAMHGIEAEKALAELARLAHLSNPEPVSLCERPGVLGTGRDVDLGAGLGEVTVEDLKLPHKHIISNVSSPSVSCKCGEPGCGGNCEECVVCGEMLPEHYFEDGLRCNKCLYDCPECADGDALREDEECAYCGEGRER